MILGDAQLTAETCSWALKPVNTERLPHSEDLALIW